MESRLQFLFSEEESDRLAEIQKRNAEFAPGQPIITYDLLRKEISCAKWLLPLDDLRVVLSSGPITASFEESTWPYQGTLGFLCDFGDVPVTPGKGADRCFSATLTTPNVYELERYLRWKKDHASARNLRRMLPQVDFDPPPLFERLGKKLSLIP